jgi:hypothetical protein
MRQINQSIPIRLHPHKIGGPLFSGFQKFRSPLLFFDMFRLLWRYPKMMCAAVN